MSHLRMDEWKNFMFNDINNFLSYWEEMWSYWPSSFPMVMEENDWNKEYQKWIDRGMPPPVDSYRGINDGQEEITCPEDLWK